ncbi:MAG: hypothetical protein ACRDNZ_15510, partial [Streptosporangiaceae bacterium]
MTGRLAPRGKFLASVGIGHAGGWQAWAADLESAGPRRWLQVALGWVWIVDAALQYQPYMFTRSFVTQIIDPVSAGNPAVISNAVLGSGEIILSHPVIFNAAFATIQLVIGMGLLRRRTSRAALAATIAWALGVWWLAEGLGGILTGSASPVTGAPGAALMYVVIAVLAWPRKSGAKSATGPRRSAAGATGAGSTGADDTGAGSIAAGSRIGMRGAQLIWVSLWVSSACFVVQAPNRAAGALRDTVAGLASGEPGWIAAMDRGAASAIGSSRTALLMTLAIVFLIIAAGVLVPTAIRPALILAVFTAVLIWAVGENFGGILTGQGT